MDSMSEKFVEDAGDVCCAVDAERSNAGTLAALSAVLASACCGLPLLLLAVGLGSLGLGKPAADVEAVYLGQCRVFERIDLPELRAETLEGLQIIRIIKLKRPILYDSDGN